MCNWLGFYNYPGSIWFMGGMFIFRALFAVVVLVLGYKLIKSLLDGRSHTN